VGDGVKVIVGVNVGSEVGVDVAEGSDVGDGVKVGGLVVGEEEASCSTIMSCVEVGESPDAQPIKRQHKIASGRYGFKFIFMTTPLG
jgi:hypothetical protein